MKKEMQDIINAVGNLSCDSVRKLDGGFELSEDVKGRVYQKTLRRTGIKEKCIPDNISSSSHRNIGLKKPVMVAVALMLVMSIGAGAIVGAGRLSRSFSQSFRTLPEENYQGIIFDIDQTMTDNGVTVTLSQGMCDGYVLYVIERIDFDPSVVTLTDDMFQRVDGSYNAPYLYDEIAVNPDYPRYCVSTNYCKLIEHDAHSMTWLKTFGTTGAGTEIFGFFTIGSKFVLKAHDIQNLPDNEKRECKFQFEFDIKRSEPVVYNLPEETYRFDGKFLEDCFSIMPPLAYEFIPDVWLNPWFMEIIPATQNGKILNTKLKSDQPALVITLNNGKRYTDWDGIGWAENPALTRDMFGADYNKYEGFYLTFNEEIDITNINSITLYGYELIKASMPESVYADSYCSVKKELPASNPVKISDEARTVEVTEIRETEKGCKEFPAGTLQYSVKNIGIYDNLYATKAKKKDVSRASVDNTGFVYYDENKEMDIKPFEDAFDIKSGRLRNGFYLVEYEIEITNVDSPLTAFDYSIFHLQVYCDYNEEYGKKDSLIAVPLAYVLGEGADAGGHTLLLEKGKTSNLRVGFIVNDNHRGSLSQIGLSVGPKFEKDPDFVNITKAAGALEK